MSVWVRVLGIDPGYRKTGYGVIDTDGQASRHVANGSISATRSEPAERLKALPVFQHETLQGGKESF